MTASEVATSGKEPVGFAKGHFVRDVWYGRRSLAQTFWLWGMLVGGAVSVLVTGALMAASVATSTQFPIYLAPLVTFPVSAWGWVGTWRSARRRAGAWALLARVAVVFGAVVALFTFLSPALALPGLLRARQAGNEASAIGSLRAISSAQAAYAAVCGAGFYAPSLAALASPGLGDEQTTPFISPDMATEPFMKNGYRITLTAGPPAADSPRSCNGVPAGQSSTTYFVSAAPTVSGGRYFAANAEGAISSSLEPIPVTFTGSPPSPAPASLK